jgi:hypothetical protein
MDPSRRFLGVTGVSVLTLLALNIVLVVVGPAAIGALRQGLGMVQAWIQAAV